MYLLRKTDSKGQTAIETVLLVGILIFLLLGIAEFSRAWWLKNQLNNAARVGARCASVQKPWDVSAIQTCTKNSITTASIRNSSTVTVTSSPDNPPVTGAGDIITVGVTASFTTIVPNLHSLIPGMGQIFPTTLHSEASMRYED
jgi:Flp pilus assembly protein TadG